MRQILRLHVLLAFAVCLHAQSQSSGTGTSLSVGSGHSSTSGGGSSGGGLPPNTCTGITSGSVQADNSVSGSPRLGDVYRVQGTITANYVNDDAVAPATITVCPGGSACSPGSANSVTSGLYLVNAHTNGTNTYAANLAAGYLSPGVWQSGTWTYNLQFSDLLSNTCAAYGTYVVSSAWNPGNGFLRSNAGTPTMYTDGNNASFWGTGWQWYGLNWVNGANQYGYAEIPGHAIVNVNGTDVSWVSGTQFSTQTLPTGVYNQIYICPTGAGSCVYHGGNTINSATDMTLAESGGTYSNADAYLGFVRDFCCGNVGHANGYQASLANAATFYAQWGENINRFSSANTYMSSIKGSYLGTGYNTYNYATSGASSNWGLPAIDLWFSAAHAAGIHILMGAMSADNGNCPGFVCTGNESSNLQHYWAMVAARYGAFIDVWELTNEAIVPQTWTDLVATQMNTGVSGTVGGRPADPYQHLFTVDEWPPGYGTYPSGSSNPYGPGTSTPDNNLTLADIPHSNGKVNGNGYVYSALSDFKSDTGQGGCPNIPYLLTTMPRFQGEGPAGQGVTQSAETAQNPKDEVNGNRVVDAAYLLNRCVSVKFTQPQDYFPINTVNVATTWLDLTQGALFLQTFMQGLEVTAAPLAVTLGGGCVAGACSYSALGTTDRVRLILNSNTGNGTTGVPNSVTGGTAALTVPASGLTCKWINPQTGAVISTVNPTAGSYTFTAPTFPVDAWLQCDP